MIWIDSRVGSRELLRMVQRYGGEAELTQADAADFYFDGNGPDGPVCVGIERKAIRDLVGSIRTGRLQDEQLPTLSAMYEYVYLVVEGIYRPDPDSGVLQVPGARGQWMDLQLGSRRDPRTRYRQRFMYSEVFNTLLTLELKANVMVLRSGSMRETAFLVAGLHSYWQKEWDEHHGHEAIKHQGGVTLQRSSVLRRVAAELPGIGWKRSKQVEMAFGTIQDMVNAGVDDWAGISWESKTGRNMTLGRAAAKKVWDEIRRRQSNGFRTKKL